MSWRLLVTPPAPGAAQMAIDEAMLEACRLGLAPPTLRLYRWDVPTLSLGYAQRPESVDLPACRREGVAVVRRPTGGRAVLHAGDFTYAVVATHLPPGVAAAYRELAGALERSLAHLGLTSELRPGVLPGARSEACFAAATTADLCVGASKLIGSAQVRRDGAVLQHGSLYLRFPAELAARALPGARPVDLESMVGPTPWERVAEAFQAGFEGHFGVRLVAGELSEWEMARAQENVSRFQLEAREAGA